jgi:hypothetical protein
MCMGSPVTVSWLIVYVRRYFFAKKFEHIIESQLSSRTQTQATVISRGEWFSRLAPWRKANSKRFSRTEYGQYQASDGEKCAANGSRVRTDMIRRVDGAPQLVDPSGWLHSDRKETGATDPASRGRPERMSTVRSARLQDVESSSDLDEDDV